MSTAPTVVAEQRRNRAIYAVIVVANRGVPIYPGHPDWQVNYDAAAVLVDTVAEHTIETFQALVRAEAKLGEAKR